MIFNDLLQYKMTLKLANVFLLFYMVWKRAH